MVRQRDSKSKQQEEKGQGGHPDTRIPGLRIASQSRSVATAEWLETDDVDDDGGVVRGVCKSVGVRRCLRQADWASGPEGREGGRTTKNHEEPRRMPVLAMYNVSISIRSVCLPACDDRCSLNPTTNPQTNPPAPGG